MDYLLCGAMGKKRASERASEQGGAAATTTSSRFHAFHSKDILEKPASERKSARGICISRPSSSSKSLGGFFEKMS